MKKLLFALAVVALGASVASAQRVQVQAKGVIGLRGDLPLLTADGLEQLKLTAEQKDKYAKIETDYKDKMKATQTQFQTDLKNLNDRTKGKELIEKLQTDNKKTREEALANVEPLLTGEQKKVFAQVKGQQPQPGGIIGRPPVGPAGNPIGQVLPAGVQQRLQLTDEQKKQIDAIQKDVEAKILKVLSDEQRKQLEQMKKGPGLTPRPGQPANPANPRVRPANPAVDAAPAPAIKRD